MKIKISTMLMLVFLHIILLIAHVEELFCWKKKWQTSKLAHSENGTPQRERQRVRPTKSSELCYHVFKIFTDFFVALETLWYPATFVCLYLKMFVTMVLLYFRLSQAPQFSLPFAQVTHACIRMSSWFIIPKRIATIFRFLEKLPYIRW